MILYLSRWPIEEYYREKKQEYDFKNMMVRALGSMNNLNTYNTSRTYSDVSR